MTALSTGYLERHRAAIETAAQRIGSHVLRTPWRRFLDSWLKLESLQRSGSFKVRGACNALLALPERPSGVVATSSGNHAAAITAAAQTLGIRVTVLIPQDALASKVDAARAQGAEVIITGVSFANRDRLAAELAADRGWPFVHSSDNWDVIHGQATVAEEILAERPGIDTIVVPVGGGGLLGGTALAVKSRVPGVRVIGVEPELADDAATSLRTGRLHRLPGPVDTLADGARVTALGERPFEVIVGRGLVDDIVTVSEASIRAAWDALAGIPAEPTAALPVAALLDGAVRGGPGTALVISGGNVARPRILET